MPKHKPKHKLEKWFIISGDGVRPYISTKQNKPIKDKTTFQASALVAAWAWIIVRLKSCLFFSPLLVTPFAVDPKNLPTTKIEQYAA